MSNSVYIVATSEKSNEGYFIPDTTSRGIQNIPVVLSILLSYKSLPILTLLAATFLNLLYNIPGVERASLICRDIVDLN